MSNESQTYKAQMQVDAVANYLYENNNHVMAQRVKSAAAEVLAFSNGFLRKNRYNKQVNSSLCEALLELNYDKNCPQNYRLIVGKLVEKYREMNGMPVDDFYVASGDISSDFADEVRGEEDFADFVNKDDLGEEDCDSCEGDGCVDCKDDEYDSIKTIDETDSEEWLQYVIDNTEVGEEYTIKDISDDLSKHKGVSDEDNFGFSAIDDTIDLVKELITYQYFEVTERDSTNGKISVIQRVR